VAVTKSVSVGMAALLPELGVLHLGESRPQELWRKAATLSSAVHWHMIGHLQRNKVERTLPLVQLIHAVDSERLLLALEAEGKRRERGVDVLLEVNASREAAKQGFAPEAVSILIPRLAELHRVRVLGLMTMAAFDQEPEHCRPTFAEVRRLRDELAGRLWSPHRMEHLSMGMSNDFEVAIEEGATLVRIGSALWEGLPGAEP
jgi:pyridoxal phosphate enzyme (YggS family)